MSLSASSSVWPPSRMTSRVDSCRSWLSVGLVQELAVGLQVHDAVGLEEVRVALQEDGAGEPFVWLLGLGVGEGQPYLRHLAGTEEGVDEVYSGAEEGHVGHGVLGGVLGAFPEAGALDVHSDVVVLGKPLGQGDGVLSLAAAEFQDYRTVIAEDF